MADNGQLDENISKSFIVFKDDATIPTDKQTEEYLNAVLSHFSSKIWDMTEILTFFDEGQELSRRRRHKVSSFRTI